MGILIDAHATAVAFIRAARVRIIYNVQIHQGGTGLVTVNTTVTFPVSILERKTGQERCAGDTGPVKGHGRSRTVGINDGILAAARTDNCQVLPF